MSEGPELTLPEAAAPLASIDDEATADGQSAGAEAAREDPAVAPRRLPEIPVAERAEIGCQADLDRVLAAHKAWIAAVLDPKIEVASGRANLQGADLRGYKLAGANLSGANLSGANLAECDLSHANLTVANLQGACLACTNLGGARLTRAKLEGADLRGADLIGAVLTGVDLTKATLHSPADPTPAPVPERAGAVAAGPQVPASQDSSLAVTPLVDLDDQADL